jgi:isoleucyl-tRNA synthetase
LIKSRIPPEFHDATLRKLKKVLFNRCFSNLLNFSTADLNNYSIKIDEKVLWVRAANRRKKDRLKTNNYKIKKSKKNNRMLKRKF